MNNENDIKHILVTGASSGIGKAIVELMLQQNAKVVGVSRDISHLAFDHQNFSAEAMDLSDLKSLPRTLAALEKKYPEINTLVCCAGVGRFGSLEEFSFEQISAVIDLNLTSQIYLIRQFMPVLKRNKSGDIVLIGSEAALSGGRKGAVYSASKFALRGFAQALRDESSKSGVRISMINPGMVKTPFFDDLSFAPGENPENYIEPADVAEAVKMVISARAGTVFDEINLSPLKKTINFNPKKS